MVNVIGARSSMWPLSCDHDTKGYGEVSSRITVVVERWLPYRVRFFAIFNFDYSCKVVQSKVHTCEGYPDVYDVNSHGTFGGLAECLCAKLLRAYM